MDAVRDKFLKCLINDTVTHYRRFAGKMRADDADREVSATAIAGVPGVQRRVVPQLQPLRFKAGQAQADLIAECVQGRVLRNGLTVTR